MRGESPGAGGWFSDAVAQWRSSAAVAKKRRSTCPLLQFPPDRTSPIQIPVVIGSSCIHAGDPSPAPVGFAFVPAAIWLSFPRCVHSER
jgi:hypothetical protein